MFCVIPANKIWIFTAKMKWFRIFIAEKLMQKVSWFGIKIAYNLIFHAHLIRCNIREFLTRLSMPYPHRYFQAIHFLFLGLMGRPKRPIFSDQSTGPWIPVYIIIGNIISPCNHVKSFIFRLNRIFVNVFWFRVFQSSTQSFWGVWF